MIADALYLAAAVLVAMFLVRLLGGPLFKAA
jgi:hypothetical protein